jgi:predicted TIM-barrel fold metal-dependent hydrolase
MTTAPDVLPISSDSHITEPPDCYIAHIDPTWRDRAPRVVSDAARGDLYVVDGMKQTIPMSLVAAAGKDPSTLSMRGGKFEDLHRGGWDPKARLGDQDRDGVGAEIIYPTVGMVLCNHPDLDLKVKCFEAYNRWLGEYVSHDPNRLIGIGQTAIRTVKDGIEDLQRIKAMGFKGVMMPGNPGESDYDDPIYDPFWEAAVALDLPLSFHILTSSADHNTRRRGPKMNSFLMIIRGCQDIMAMMILSGVFARHPKLRVACVEADAGWGPHFMYRMDHAYKRHRYWLQGQELPKLPSEYFKENIRLTFQDDHVAFQLAHMMAPNQLMWANDFPHSDSTWPWSQDVIAHQTAGMDPTLRRRILRDNVAEFYGLG